MKAKVLPLRRQDPGSGERFLKGPVPWAWIEGAGRLSGKALHLGIALWLLAGMRKSQDVSLSLSGRLLAELGVHRDAARRALDQLESAGLVEVTRAPGRKPRIKVVTTAMKPPAPQVTRPLGLSRLNWESNDEE